MKHKIPTPEEIRCSWLDVSETYAVAKTLRENAVEPSNRYAEKEKQALRESDFWLDLYIDLYPKELAKIAIKGVENAKS